MKIILNMREITNKPKKMLPKRTHLWECKVNEDTSLYKQSNESIEINTLNTNDEIRNHLLRYDIIILEASFHDVWVECMELYTTTNRLSMSGDAFFWEGRSSHNSHEMRLSGMPSMGLLISPILRTYTTNIGIWRVSIPMYASMFWVTFAGDSTAFRCGVSWH